MKKPQLFPVYRIEMRFSEEEGYYSTWRDAFFPTMSDHPCTPCHDYLMALCYLHELKSAWELSLKDHIPLEFRILSRYVSKWEEVQLDDNLDF